KKFDAACWINGEQPCAWGYARLIWGLAALPESARTREVQRTLRRGVEFLLSYRVERGNYPSPYGASYLWRQLSFPLFYQADVLFVLRALDAAGGLDDDRAQPAIAWLLARQDPRGRWAGRAPYAARMPSKVDASKWVTLQVCTLLKHAFPENGALPNAESSRRSRHCGSVKGTTARFPRRSPQRPRPSTTGSWVAPRPRSPRRSTRPDGTRSPRPRAIPTRSVARHMLRVCASTPSRPRTTTRCASSSSIA